MKQWLGLQEGGWGSAAHAVRCACRAACCKYSPSLATLQLLPNSCLRALSLSHPPTRPLAGHRAAAAGGAKLEAEQPLVVQHYEAAARQEVEAAGGMFGLVEQHQLRERMGGE